MFISNTEEDDIKRERGIARRLRKSNWWNNKCSKGICYYCNSKVPPNELTIDHIVPIIRGGRSTKNNIVPSCKQCNTKKKYMLPMEWDEYLTSISDSFSG